MRVIVKLWLVLALFVRTALVGSPIREPKPEKKHYPPLREEWLTDPALKRELKRGF